jgi:hypothetical protein
MNDSLIEDIKKAVSKELKKYEMKITLNYDDIDVSWFDRDCQCSRACILSNAEVQKLAMLIAETTYLQMLKKNNPNFN